ncbi:hypothetical protein SLEP1_g25604 [Rubroshorea leprosula]|uniref:Uncharacterized protein n=1 Tax=Rubroshorea leprosula TaxID=152421 RepID=A0AAV5JJB5_9ROSI|nr:hypothetical protein SLEP1_g25604 [Rubroshorea leprosula]
MVHTRSVRAGNSSLPHGQGQPSTNLPPLIPPQLPPQLTPQLPPQVPIMFPPVDHVEGGDENQPHASAHNSTSTANQDVVTAQLAAMQQHLEKLVAEHRGAPPPHHVADSIPHPLNTNITLEPYPAGFKIPQLETYDGTKDPDDHLHAFYSCMQAQNASDALMCKIFPSTLREMTSAFATKFSSRRLIRKTTSELIRVKQRDGESLKNYMRRFNDAVLEVSSFDQAVGIAAVISGLKHDRFRDSLIKYAATSFSEEKDEDGAELRFDVDLPTEIRKDELNTPAAICRYCDFHQDHGHTTEQCNSLQSELESLAQKGMLNEYVQRAEQSRFIREQRPQPQGVRNPPNRQGVGYQQAPPPLPPPVKHQNRAQKWKIDDAEWKNQPITFTSADLDTVVTPHNDPLVTSVMINNCEKYDGPIYGFNNQPVPVEGVLTLHVAFGSGRTYVTPSVRFLVVKMASSFNIVIGRPTLTEIRAVHVMGVEIIDNQPDDEARAALVEDVEEVLVDDRDPSRKTQIGTKLNPEERAELIAFLQANNDVFAWTSADMLGIPKSVFQHKLSTNPLKKPVAQKRRLFGGERLQAIKEEVEKLLQAGFVRKVDYCEWVANPVLVKKANGNERLSLLDAYSGYHQVPMAPEDEEKTLFYAGDEIYCYVMMPFGLKNAGATYQKMVTIVFRAQIGKNLEVYVDDIVGKSRKTEDHLADLDETFNNLKKNRMRLNPAKYEAISSVLVREETKQQKPIYYINSVLHGAELRYPITEKAALAVVTSARKLRPYFQSHQIIVLTDQPLRQILQKPECSERLIKWAVELGEFEIMFQQRSAIRAQALADFIVECTPCPSTSTPEPNDWTLYVDGASSSKGSGAGALLIGLEGYRSEHALKFNFDATNNMAEYEALLLGLQLALELKISAIQVYSDSQLVVNQINSICEVVDPVMVKYVALVAELKCKFQKFCLSKIPRAENEQADSLSKFASNSSLSSRSVFMEVLDEPSFMKPRMMEISTDPDTSSWTDSIISFFARWNSTRGQAGSNEVEEESVSVHEGVCGSHVGAKTLAHKVLRQGYYWPNMHKDATYFVQKCPKCPFVKGVSGVTHLVVGVDYFTKWVEARPLSSLTSKKVEDFVFSSIIYRYGIPNQIVADNGTQFNCSSFRDFCSSYGIKLQFTSVYHPESNGMVESVNKCILEGIKPRLEQHKAKWADELNNVLWAYRTTSRTATDETPYHLAFGTEAVIPVEIGVPSFRVTHFDEGRNGQLLRENLDLLAEVKEETRLRTLVYKQKLANFYNKRPRIGKALMSWPKCHILAPMSSKTLKEREFLESGMSIT